MITIVPSKRPIRVVSVFGTRPEAIKMAPVILALVPDPAFAVRVIVTGQHREMLDQVLRFFQIRPDADLDLMRPGQSPSQVVERVLAGLGPLFERERPDLVLVHGDTISTFAGALAAFFQKIPVAHVEAGLRTEDRYDPFPEEMDRRLTGVLAELHFAPTHQAKVNLLKENTDPERVYVTGNTVIDALLEVARGEHTFEDCQIREAVASGRRLLLVTAHRRENWGEPHRRVFEAIRALVDRHDDVEVVFPVHRNPVVRESARALLAGRERIRLIEPPAYPEFVHLLKASTLVLTDSGGLQEEAPALGKPVLVLRETTERPEGIAAGTCLKVGTDPERILQEASRLLQDPVAYDRMARAVNPYGDGKAAERIRLAILHAFGASPRPADFCGEAPT